MGPCQPGAQRGSVTQPALTPVRGPPPQFPVVADEELPAPAGPLALRLPGRARLRRASGGRRALHERLGPPEEQPPGPLCRRERRAELGAGCPRPRAAGTSPPRRPAHRTPPAGTPRPARRGSAPAAPRGSSAAAGPRPRRGRSASAWPARPDPPRPAPRRVTAAPPPPSHPGPGARQLRPLPSFRREAKGSSVAESCSSRRVPSAQRGWQRSRPGPAAPPAATAPHASPSCARSGERGPGGAKRNRVWSRVCQ